MFDIKNDIVFSSMYAPQRQFGYCRLYDELAPLLGMKIDCEPVYFQYDGKRWLIEFWKGQYGLETGAEIGVYVTDKEDINIPGVFSGTFYESISDEELLKMEYTLMKNENLLIRRKEKHWWLTGFDVGTFSDTDELSLEIKITFPSLDMQKAFIEGLYQVGYNTNDIIKRGKVVKLIFTKPKTNQLNKFNKIYLKFIQMKNKFYCKLFNFVTRDFTRTIDKIDFLMIYYPALFKVIIRFADKKNLNKLYGYLQDYINR
ncbi:protein of unknown function [Clostridium sp. DSM 8431]|nr:protein of unknown function [Clostridium sp. DSM 8431]